MTRLSEVPASTRSTEDWLIQVNPKLSGVPRTIALLFAQLTHELAELPPSVQRDNGMVKLLEAKDCFVRAVVPDGS